MSRLPVRPLANSAEELYSPPLRIGRRLLRSGARAHSPAPLLRTWFSKQVLFTGQ
jgi:hypothetical protein